MLKKFSEWYDKQTLFVRILLIVPGFCCVLLIAGYWIARSIGIAVSPGGSRDSNKISRDEATVAINGERVTENIGAIKSTADNITATSSSLDKIATGLQAIVNDIDSGPKK